MRKLIIIMLSLIVLSACNTPKPAPVEISRVSIGKVVDISLIPPTLFLSVQTRIKTEKAIVVIFGAPPVLLEVETFMVTFDNKKQYFTYAGSASLYRIWHR